MKEILLTAFCICILLATRSQIVIDNSIDGNTAVNDILLGQGVTAQNITFQGDLNQIGSFQSNGSNLPISEGVILGTGNVNLASNPNINDPNTSGSGGNNSDGGSLGGQNFGQGDPDLQSIANVSTHDAAVLEFDFEAVGETVEFNFVFASEEYPEYVCGTVNDAFGFFLSGPGIDGGGAFDNNAINLALIPDSDPPVPITINTVNPGVVGFAGDAVNCSNISPDWMTYSTYYIDNSTTSNDQNRIEYDGFTVVITASANVQCGETYHIKMAIADGGDSSLDSAVFLEASSFSSESLEIELAQDFDFMPNDSTVYEGCGNTVFSITRGENDMSVSQLDLEITGSASNGIDYLNLPTQLTFNENQTEIEFDIQVIEDFITEGIESVTINILSNTGCSSSSANSITFYIQDIPPIQIEIDDQTLNCGATGELNPTVTGGIGEYSYSWSTGEDTPSIQVQPNQTTEYTLTVSDTCSVSSETVQTTVNVPNYDQLLVEIGADTTVSCMNLFSTSPTVSGGSLTYSYEWTFNGNHLSNDLSIEEQFTNSGYLSLNVTDECENNEQDSLFLNVENTPLELTLYDTTICLPGNAILTPEVSGGNGNIDYLWSPVNSTESMLAVSPQESTYYTLQVSDECDNEVQDSLLVTTEEFEINFTHNYIDDNTLAFFSESSPEADMLTWYFDNSGISHEENPIYSFNNSFQDHYISLTGVSENGCTDSVSTVIFPPLVIYIPTAFTPDNDGVNERFYVRGTEGLEFEFMIFDRDGHLIFKTNDINEGWNGSIRNGQHYAPDGIYAYSLYAKGYAGNIISRKGHITLIR